MLAPRGRLLNHAISSVGGSKFLPRSFTGRYVFDVGELLDVGDVALAMEAAGFEVRDVESLREHYGLTLRHPVANLQQHWDNRNRARWRGTGESVAALHGSPPPSGSTTEGSPSTKSSPSPPNPTARAACPAPDGLGIDQTVARRPPLA